MEDLGVRPYFFVQYSFILRQEAPFSFPMIIVNDGVGHIFSCKISPIQFHRKKKKMVSGWDTVVHEEKVILPRLEIIVRNRQGLEGVRAMRRKTRLPPVVL